MAIQYNNIIRLFVTVSEQLYRDAILYELVNQKDIELVGESHSGADTLEKITLSEASTLIIEESLADTDGLTISELAMAKKPSLSIILIVDKPVSQNRMAIYLESGIKSVIAKTQTIYDLNDAVGYTRNGQYFIDAEKFRVDYDIQLKQSLSRKFQSLSEREQEVAKLITQRISLSEIAENLGVSNKTVHTYKDRIFVKLGLTRLPELIVFMSRIEQHPNLETVN